MSTQRLQARPRFDIAAAIRAARKAAGLTQTELGTRTGLDQKKLSDYETGRVSPRLRTAERIFDELGADFAVIPRTAAAVDPADVERYAQFVVGHVDAQVDARHRAAVRAVLDALAADGRLLPNRTADKETQR